MNGKEPVGAKSYPEGYYEESCGGHEFFSRYGPRVPKPPLAYALARAGLRERMKVLDIGCGRGEVLYGARQKGAWAVGTDFSAAAVRKARQASGCAALLCDAKALPFSGAAFDRVFFLGVIDHLHDWELEKVFAEIARVLKPGGFVLVHSCVNRSYYKNWSFGLRAAAARGCRALGLSVREPVPPRSGEDLVLHVNEHTARGLKTFFRRIGWEAEVEARPNYKLCLKELYGDPLPEGFPLKPASAWKRWLYRVLLFRGPLRALLARELFAVVSPRIC